MNGLARRAEDAATLASVRAGEPGAMDTVEQRWNDAVADYLSNLGMTGEALQRARRAVFESVRTQLPTATPASLASFVMRCALEVGGSPELHPQRDGGEPEARLLSARDVSEAVEDPDVVALLWNSATVLGPAARATLDLHYRHGLDPDEIAEALDQPRLSVEERLERLPLAYESALRCALAWRAGDPDDERLTAALAAAGVEDFSPEAVRVIAEVLEGDEELTARVSPELSALELFSALEVTGVQVSEETPVPEPPPVEDEPVAEDEPESAPVEEPELEPEPEPEPEEEPEPPAVSEPVLAGFSEPLGELPRRRPAEAEPAPEEAPEPQSPPAVAATAPSPQRPAPAAAAEAPPDEDLMRLARILGAAIAGLLVIYILRGGRRKRSG